MQALDRHSIDVEGIAGEVLMESAGRGLFRSALEMARTAARAEKDWAKADTVRDTLKDMGFTIEDRSAGSVLRKI